MNPPAITNESFRKDLIIIGGGPAGLSCAYFAKKHALNYVVLEAGEIGDSWKNMSVEFSLITPMWTNHLPSDFLHHNPFGKMSCNRYGDYLEAYAKKNNLKVKNNCKVAAIKKTDQGYLIVCNNQKYHANCIVIATGYFKNPNVPAVGKKTDRLHKNSYSLSFHSNHFDCNSEKIQKAKKEILIVGKGNTAGQLAASLIKKGKKVGISIRGPIAFRNDDTIKGRIKQFLYFYWELIIVTRYPKLKQNSFPPMDATGVKTHYDSGRINTYAEIESITGNRVKFTDGREGDFSAIIFATGHQPAYKTLEITPSLTAEDTASSLITRPGIFHIGIDNQYNFRSRYLRGIRSDANKVVAQCESYLTEKS